MENLHSQAERAKAKLTAILDCWDNLSDDRSTYEGFECLEYAIDHINDAHRVLIGDRYEQLVIYSERDLERCKLIAAE